MSAWPDDLRLIVTLAVNALMLAACWRVARRSNARVVVALPDAILLWLAAQYAIVGVAGMLGILFSGVLLAFAGAASIAVFVWSRSPSGRGVRGEGDSSLRSRERSRIGFVDAPSPQPSPEGRGSQTEDRIVLAALAFVVAYGGALCFNQRYVPQLATDPMVYHLPAAAQWIQAHRITLVDFWYWLPASTHSPLAGSLWIAWWIAPLGNDALARFAQLPTWLLLFAATLRLLRDVRVPTSIASLTAIAVVVARPFVSQVTIPKDDIAVAALAIVLLGGIHPRRLRERVSVARLGVAFGLMLSVKYPAPLALPTLVPAIALMRWRLLGLRGVVIANAIALTFVAPWLVRNALLTGNPVFPFFNGDAPFIADPMLRSPRGVYDMLAGSFHSLPPTTWLIAIASLAFAAVARRRASFARDPVTPALVVGPPLAIVVLVFGCPFPEIRYLFTAIAALLAAIGVAIAGVPARRARVPLAIGVLVASLATSFDRSWLPAVAGFAGVGAVGATLAWMLEATSRTTRRSIVAAGALTLAIAIYVYWPAFLRQPETGYASISDAAWIARYGSVGESWAVVRERVPAGSTIAVANTPTTWPLFGFDLRNRIVHASVRPGVTHLYQLPPIRTPIPARDEYLIHTRNLNDGADAATWLANLDRLHVDFVYLSKGDASPDPPELHFAAGHADRFDRLFENDAAIVWRFKR